VSDAEAAAAAASPAAATATGPSGGWLAGVAAVASHAAREGGGMPVVRFVTNDKAGPIPGAARAGVEVTLRASIGSGEPEPTSRATSGGGEPEQTVSLMGLLADDLP